MMSSEPCYTHAVLQRIWGSPDALMLIFAGGAAEFATIKAVDWLFFTNALPADPIGRFFETVRFSQSVFFAPPAQARATLSRINQIHQHVEAAREATIPHWAHQDVLFILIDYGERAHAIVFGPMSAADRQAHFETLITLGRAMGLPGLPATYAAYQQQRHEQLLSDYANTPLTEQLFEAYRTALGPFRYWLLRQLQAALIPDELRAVTRLPAQPLVNALLRGYRYLPGGGNKVRWLHGMLLPPPFGSQLRQLARKG
jgi:uncharacterized protein (DUF2236 family)